MIRLVIRTLAAHRKQNGCHFLHSFNIDNLCRIEQPGDGGGVGQASGDDKAAIIYAFCPAGPQSLAGGVYAGPLASNGIEESPLAAVGVAGEDEFNRPGNEREVFRVVGEQDVESRR